MARKNSTPRKARKPKTDIYHALISFESVEERNCENQHTITYRADSDEQAVRDAFRWAENRQKECPQWFGKPLAMKVSWFTPNKMEENGFLYPATGGWFYEWKCDTGERGSVSVGAPSEWFDRLRDSLKAGA